MGGKLKAPSEIPFQLFRKLKSHPLCFSVLAYSFLLPRRGGAEKQHTSVVANWARRLVYTEITTKYVMNVRREAQRTMRWSLFGSHNQVV